MKILLLLTFLITIMPQVYGCENLNETQWDLSEELMKIDAARRNTTNEEEKAELTAEWQILYAQRIDVITEYNKCSAENPDENRDNSYSELTGTYDDICTYD